MATSKKRPPDPRFDPHPAEPLPATPEVVTDLPVWSGATAVVGTSRPRIDAYERVSGAARYTYDVTLNDMLHGATLRCPHPHARVLRVDTAAAAKMPGVRAILTAQSPEADIGWYTRTGTPQSKLFDPHCRYAGEEVAAVAAETVDQAWDAVRAIRVDYEVLPFAIDPETALAPGAPPIHDGGNQEGIPVELGRGEVDRGFADADAVAEGTFTVGTHIHVPMESFGSVARWDGPKLTVWDSTQGVYSIMFALARALGLPHNNLRVVCPYVGGGFGAKLRLGKYTVMAALMARSTGRPVKLFLTREETYTAVGNRPAARMTLKAGGTKAGRLTALDLTSLATGGAYGGNRYNVGAQVLDLYTCANVRVVERWAYTNTGPARAMRAPGFPQCSFALEQVMDMLAEKLAIDPVALRLANIPTYSQADDKKRPYTTTGLADCITSGADTFGWKEARSRPRREGHLVRGVGMGACNWLAGFGGPPSTATVKLFVDGSATVRTGASDLGTGTKTVAVMVVAEELAIPVERINIVHADTATTPFHYTSGGSQTLPGAIPAVRLAAADVRRQLLALAAEDLEVAAADLEIREGAVVSRTDADKTKPIGAVLQGHDRLDIVGVGHRAPNPEGEIVRPFGAQFVEVEVNRLTGEVRLLRLVGAHDSGRVINRTTFDNQVMGGMVHGIGFAMTEHRVMDRATGVMVNRNGHDYKVPTALDVPADQLSLPVDPGDTKCNNLGAKGLGEPPVIPTGGAIANAVYDALAVRVTDAPIGPPTVLAALARSGAAGRGGGS